MPESRVSTNATLRVVSSGSRAEALSDEVIGAFRAEGLNASRHTVATAGATVVLFDEVEPELCALVRGCSQLGRKCVIAISAASSALPERALWRLLDAGANDVFGWDPSCGPAAVAARVDRWTAVDRLIGAPEVRDELVGESLAWRSVLRPVVEIARFTDSPVLITGESGTGKELVARLIHALDPRPRKGDLVVLDCTTVVPTLSGSEFFGHERGAFTGADSTRDGVFALADGGTLFLDEVGELPLTLQAELLRVVQEGTYKRVGDNVWRQTRFRLICATNKDLLGEATEGRFRSDFYYRISAWQVDLPSLRDRRDDILPLTRHFLRRLHPEHEPHDLEAPVRDFLVRRDYQGNVRELRHLVTRMGHRHVGPGPITIGDVPKEERVHEDDEDWRNVGFERSIQTALILGTGLKEITSAAAETAIRLAIVEEGGNLQRASRRLGVTPRALQLRRAAQRGNGQPSDVG